MTTRILPGLLLTTLLLAPLALAAECPEGLAQEATDSWIKLTDAGDAATSWDQASTFFKGAMTKERWTESLNGYRAPLGKVVSRKIASRQYTETLAGMPDGQYVVIQLATAFEKKASATESLTAMRDSDGTWRVSGYFIR